MRSTILYLYFCISCYAIAIDIGDNRSQQLSTNQIDFNCFLFDYIKYMKWRHVTIIINDIRFSPQVLQLQLSSKGIQSAVLNAINEMNNNISVIGSLTFTGKVTHLIVLGKNDSVTSAANDILKSNILKLKSYVLILCIDCEATPKLQNARDIFGSFLWAIPRHTFATIHLYGMCYNYLSKEFYANLMGNWSSKDGIAIGNQMINQHQNLQGVTLNLQAILADVDDPQMLSQAQNNTLEGFIADLINIMAESLNFSYQIGNICNYSAINMISIMKNQSYDMTLFPITMTPSRVGLTEFTSPFFNEKVVVGIARSSHNTNISYFWLFKPFHICVWITVAFVVFIMLCAKVATKLWSHPTDPNDSGGAIFLLYTVLQQGMPHFPVACSSKIVVVTAYFTCWLLFAFYTATLISALTCNKPHEITVQDVKDLQRDIGLADASVLELLKTTKDPLLKVLSMRTFTIWERKNYAASFCKQEWVYIGSKATLHRLLTAGNNTECDVQFSKETVYSISSHFTVKKDNVFSKRISKVIRKLHESGIIARLRKRLSQTKHKDKLEFVQIGISSLYGLLIIWGIGIVASLAAVLMERFL